MSNIESMTRFAVDDRVEFVSPEESGYQRVYMDGVDVTGRKATVVEVIEVPADQIASVGHTQWVRVRDIERDEDTPCHGIRLYAGGYYKYAE